MRKIAVFASGSGSNFESIANAIQVKQLNAEISLLVCDNPKAYVIQRAKQQQIPAFIFSPKDYENKEAFETRILDKLEEYQVDFIVLAGYMRLIGSTLLSAYSKRIVNIHPSLLPSFPGKDAIGQAFQAGVKVTGVTVHFVDEGMDTGPIIAQKAVDVRNGDTRDTLQARIQEVEHRLFPAVLQELLQKQLMEGLQECLSER
ncbi:phosphoribosylglycinamide formyltransferase-1 [Peribacillus deserti]|uniref:Phosphoribosylglycinamide formyltransferase n=1 Tax=Peribacillus deserti TaxID=673318 RepID=A0ABS2QIQ7_9BACI|nr:phosphoribosylglycinamide formyltransferase [Peribacillus deserti]MBM7692684.1 phosphoribosylglycinamide formyltransferase-1 [Peribacillus deserti]